MAATVRDNRHAMGKRIMRFIVDFQYQNHYAPSFREIAAHVGRTESTVAYHLGRLRNEGKVAYEPRASRSVRVLDRG